MKDNPLEIDGLGYKSTSYAKCIRNEAKLSKFKDRATRNEMKLEKFSVDQQRRSLVSMKKLDLGNKQHPVPTKDMVNRKNEDRYYSKKQEAVEIRNLMISERNRKIWLKKLL